MYSNKISTYNVYIICLDLLKPLEAQGDVQQDQHQCKHHGNQTLMQELGAHGSADVAQRQLFKIVVRAACATIRTILKINLQYPFFRE